MQPGTRLGPYEIVSRIGAGGMGEVWRARDPRLERDVAIKILPAEFASDAALRIRLRREAKLISQLDDPHICRVYDTGSENGTDYLVMEYLDGHSLADRLTRGPIALAQALTIGADLATAVDRAHRAGVIHRDIKPANIMLTKSGAKLLDFGIAKETERARGGATTVTVTGEGGLVGTVEYMAPEQLDGRPADARTDVFALGSVLYEMVTGSPAFSGGTGASLIGAIMTCEPKPLRELQPRAPILLGRTVAKCLEKDPDRRWQSAADLADELRFLAAAEADRTRAADRTWPWKTATFVAVAVGIALALFIVSRPPQRRDPVHLYFQPPVEAEIFGSPSLHPIALSPDGKHIAFCGGASASLWVGSFASARVTKIEGTEFSMSPFWSHDGKYIGFVHDRALMRAPLSGGAPEVITKVPAAVASWSRRGTIVFASRGLYAVPAAGGSPRLLAAADDIGYTDPVFLPDGEHFLVTKFDRDRNQTIVVRSVADAGERTVLRDATSATWTRSGHILFARGGKLVAQRFDLRRFTVEGEPVVVSETLSTIPGSAVFAAAREGNVLVFHPGVPRQMLVKVDFRTASVINIAGPATFSGPAVSHDGLKVAYGIRQPNGEEDLWIADLTRGVSSRLTSTKLRERYPIWSPDDNWIAYGCGSNICVVPASGGAPRVVFTRGAFPTSWSPDGTSLMVWFQDGLTLFRLTDGTVRTIVQTAFQERWGRISPDGQWIAYQSNESGAEESYVQRLSDGAFKTRISTTGGSRPNWSRDGSRLYFTAYGVANQVVDIVTGPAGVRATVPRPMFEAPTALILSEDFSLLPDGSGVIGTKAVTPESSHGGLEVLVNWTSLVR